MERFLLYATGIESNLCASFYTLSIRPRCYGILTREPTESTGVCVRQRRLRQRCTGSEAARIAGMELFCVGLRRHL